MNLLDLIFPPTCEFCGKVGTYICDKCYNNIRKYEINEFSNHTLALYKYEEVMREKMLQYKFNNNAYLDNFFAEVIIKNQKMYSFLKSYDIIVPVPIHKKRKQERGYNQSEFIIKNVIKKLKIKDIKISTNILKKIKNNKPQSTMNAKERTENIKGVFEISNINDIKNKKVLIFDDIYTTGSTIKECRKMLNKCGAKKVEALTMLKK